MGPTAEEGQRVDRLLGERIIGWSERTAIEVGVRRISYRELDQRSDRLARRLAREGVRCGAVVAVAAGDIERFAIAALACLKAGAAYLAIDTRYPVERVRDILIDAAPGLLVAGAEFPDKLIPPGLPVVRDFADGTPADTMYSEPEDTSGSPDDTAYICYTSGSTGRPKGIEIAHRGIPWLVGDKDFIPFGPDDRIGQASNLAFDATTFELWGALLNGGCIVHMPKEVLFSAAALSEFIERERITVLFLTTSLFNALAASRPDAFGALKFLGIGGEAADPVSVGRVLRSGRAPRRLVNAYGPTEATTFATWHEVTPADIDAGEVPIGKPIRNMQVLLLDEGMRQVRPGEPGELFVGGPGVANGYLHRPDLTAERFVVNPFGTESADRIYRTGDLCRQLPDGSIAYLGRIDDQVKIRGFRVEPSEVMAILRRLADVEDAVVLARNGSFGTQELVAFIRADKELAVERLRHELANIVPDYMVPAIIRRVDEFPLTPNGKLDREALLANVESGTKPGVQLEQGDDVDRRMAAIWKDVLQRQDVQPDDDYYVLGGDSLSVMHLALEMESAFGITFSIDDLQSPLTVQRLAAQVRSRSRTLDPGGTSAPVARDDARPGVFAISYPWAMGPMPEEIGRALSPDQRWRHVHVPLTFFRDATQVTIEDMALHVERQIRATSPDGPYVVFGICFTGLLAYEVAQRLRAGGRRVAALVIVDSFPSLPQTRGRRALSIALRIARLAKTDFRSAASRMWRKFSSPPLAGYEDAILRACIQASQEYRPRPYDGRVVLFRPAQVPFVDPFIGKDFTAWRRLVTGPYTEHVVEFHNRCKATEQTAQSGYREIAAWLKGMNLSGI